ncbi:MAG: 1-deoxy-D-xylulose-5-phosphate reductoisomerase [Gammaproteobacteria bacterium]|nr:1-deoxy-D-xylulose-5-phosphate reductoisomerase [Gammaproteobacteria bacterium]NIR84158.1 1-deoxy-D-xylulose-5-phosphate reductoisomerase [Gammaproteobacteria bacterium]NIR89470.1 1-deoxy-D-xylulose-5-phosphate reductoisomerase [Gammaproteobacteria bacterium]NIU05313.1 1-deoxy-D-xylulose-5-phosphate reductoisomerase [Gammaproteobacteria bacterium]NIV52253.1 1-deoxy-D-xylulose-5-phosphate reductoisomerase [Gammaproteobacteria bacterium]
MIGVTILGSTGTIGINTLDVIGRNRDRFRVVALTANSDAEQLAAQCREWAPEYAVMADADAAARLHAELAAVDPGIEVLAGTDGLCEVAALPQADYVMAGIVGAAGLLPTLAAARAGKRVLLANKEALVMSGKLLMDAVRESEAELLPIDSEHNAIFQCMPADFWRGLDTVGVSRILLTASGGPFRTRASAELHEISPEEACAHPNWVMGRKISVDSATMMNKGLEVIEACWLFDTTPERVQVLIHPQSVIHSMVEYTDGSVLAELGVPDMRTPIAHALSWPERMASGVAALDLIAIGQLAFESVDIERFPCLRLAYEAVRLGGTAATILNAANEVAVGAFLDGRVRFTDIPAIIEETLSVQPPHAADSLEVVLRDDAVAREIASEQMARLV